MKVEGRLRRSAGAMQAGESSPQSGRGRYRTRALHGRATGLLQRAAEQTMQSIAALAKQWADVRTGEQPTDSRWEKTWGASVRAEHRRLAGKALGPLHSRPVRCWTASSNSRGSSVPGEHADSARLSPVVRLCCSLASPRPSSAMTDCPRRRLPARARPRCAAALWAGSCWRLLLSASAGNGKPRRTCVL